MSFPIPTNTGPTTEEIEARLEKAKARRDECDLVCANGGGLLTSSYREQAERGLVTAKRQILLLTNILFERGQERQAA